MLEHGKKCTAACYSNPECVVCGMTKRPRGRSVPLALENGMCGMDCVGYLIDPMPGHEWASEMPEMGSKAILDSIIDGGSDAT